MARTSLSCQYTYSVLNLILNMGYADKVVVARLMQNSGYQHLGISATLDATLTNLVKSRIYKDTIARLANLKDGEENSLFPNGNIAMQALLIQLGWSTEAGHKNDAIKQRKPRAIFLNNIATVSDLDKVNIAIRELLASHKKPKTTR
jgi:hypothetical protein